MSNKKINMNIKIKTKQKKKTNGRIEKRKKKSKTKAVSARPGQAAVCLFELSRPHFNHGPNHEAPTTKQPHVSQQKKKAATRQVSPRRRFNARSNNI
jgi:hypothetical protein